MERVIYSPSVYEMLVKLKNSRPSVADEEQPGRPSTSTTEENITGVHAMIPDDQG
jgi:hypothetical protein